MLLVRWISEELVEVLLGFAQRGTQLAHHRTHRLAVAEAAVQLLHPRLQRRCRLVLAHGIESLGQLRQAVRKHRVAWLKIIERSFEEKHGRRRFHRKLRAGRMRRRGDLLRDPGQSVGQRPTVGVQLVQRLNNQAKLIHAGLLARHVAAGQCGPVLLDRFDSPARLRKHCRIVEPEAGLVVVDGFVAVQGPGMLDRSDDRSGAGLHTLSLSDKEQEILRKPLRNALIASRERRVLQKNARRRPFGVHIHRNQRLGQRLKERGRQLPEDHRLACGLTIRQSQGHNTEL